MKTALPPSPLLVVYCHEPTGKRGHICLKGIRQGQRQKRLLAVIHTYRHKRRGADLFVVPCGRHPFSAALRQTLEQRFEVLELSGWLLPGGVQIVSPWRCRWKKIALPVLDAFVGELTSLLMADPDWPVKAKEEASS